MEKTTSDKLLSYIDALRPIIYMKHFDFVYIDKIIAEIGAGKNILEFNNAFGMVDFNDKHPINECTLEEFLKETWQDGFESETFIVLKDIHGELNSPKVIAY